MSEDSLMALVRRAQSDSEFRAAMLVDPEHAVRRYGFTLTEDELEAVKDAHAELAGLSSDEAEARLAGAPGEAFG